MARVAITGAEGVVGSALVSHLERDHDIIPLDLPSVDVRDRETVECRLRGADTVIHLAAVSGLRAEGGENWLSPYIRPENEQMLTSVLGAALATRGIKRFIHASSIHVEDSLAAMDRGLVLHARPRQFVTETPSGYGRNKRGQEVMVEETAAGFEHGAVSIRLGGVTPDNRPMAHHRRPDVLAHERRVWLDHDDFADLVGRIIEAKTGNNFDVLYAVSDNPGKFHDTSNRFGWQPKDRSDTA